MGHSVVGIEISEIACVQFFIEQNINYSKINLKDFNLYSVFHFEFNF